MTDQMSREEYVRSRWDLVHECDGPYMGYQKGTILVQEVRYQWAVFPSWSAAKDFTVRREDEIRQLREEIRLLRGMIALLQSEPGDETAPVYRRTIARLESALAELQKGMKV